MGQELVSTERAGAVDTRAQDLGAFPTDAFEFTPPSGSEPSLRLKAPWRFQAADKASIISSANYTILDNDFFTHFIVSCAASDRTITLPTVADNKGRILSFCKSDSGVGEVVIDGEGSETINGFTTIRVGLRYQEVTIVSTGTEWMIIAGPLQPVALEPSLGTPHTHSHSPSGGTTATAGVSKTMTCTGLPFGTKAVSLSGYFLGANTTGCLVKSMDGTVYGEGVCQGNGYGSYSALVPIDSNFQFILYFPGANASDINCNVSAYYI